jgi:sugar phosphate isomerase/epimerase
MKSTNDKIGAFINSYVYYTVKDAIEGIANAGFRYLEILSTPGLAPGLLPAPLDFKNDDIGKLTELLSRNKIEIISWYYYKGGQDLFSKEKILDEFKRMIEIADSLNINYITTDTDEVRNEQDEKEFYKYINAIGNLAAEFKIKICVDIHGSWFCNGVKAGKIIKKVNNPNVGINYCTGNAIYWGNSRPEEDIKYVIPFLFKVHLKDSSGIFQDYNFPALGQGTVDFTKILSVLKEFKGPYIAELELSNKKTPLSDINRAFKKSYNYLNHLIDKE